jgi:phospholipase C
MADISPDDKDTPETTSTAETSSTTRRDVIKTVAGAVGAAALGAALPKAFAQSVPGSLPDPASSGIDHIVVLMMENRSFDHALGWVRGADGVQAGRTFVDTAGTPHQSFHLTDFQNCASADPNHGYNAGRQHLDGGAMDGFLDTASVGDLFPIGYFLEADLPFYSYASKHWTICDRYFTSILGPTWPNRFYMHAGTTDRLTTGGPRIFPQMIPSIPGVPPALLALVSVISPTIWDLAAAAGLSARYYFDNSNPSTFAFTALWGGKYAGITKGFDQFLTDAAAGNLPSISYIDPNFQGEATGTGNDDHPLNDIRNGQAFLNQVYQALTTSPNWPKTLLVINYDEWGGFADHVVPPMAPVSATEQNAVGNGATDGNPGFAFLGFRVPCVIIGPRARRGTVIHTQYDACSILNMISWRFGLPTLGVRGTSSINMATALNFSSPPNVSIPGPTNVPPGPFGVACQTTAMSTPAFRQSVEDRLAEFETMTALMKAFRA